MQWFFVQKPTAAAYRRLHASASTCLSAAAAPLPAPRGRRRHLKRSARELFTSRWPGGSSSSSERSSTAEDHRPLGQPEAETAETSAAAVALFLPHGDDNDDAKYVRLLVSGPGEEPGYLFLFLSMVQLGGGKHRRTDPNSWPALLACKQGGGSAPMRWVNFRLPHPERLSSPTSSSSTTTSSSSPVSAKSMRFIWNNIFSKGSHMLQCLCGRSLKKNKNPTGEFVACVACECTSVRIWMPQRDFVASSCARINTHTRARACTALFDCLPLFPCNRSCAASERTKGRGWWVGQDGARGGGG